MDWPGPPAPAPDVSIVVPVFNERESVEPLCRALHEVLQRHGRPYEVILVDDGSTDGSWEVLRRMIAELPHLRGIRLRRNFGQTAAMSAGIDAARGAVIVTLDADLQNEPADIPTLLAAMTPDVDVVSGWRRERKDPFWTRRLPSMIANGLISRITGVALHDYGCTLKAYRAEVLRGVRLYGEMHRFIPALVSWVGARVVEVPVRHHPRRFGRSKYGLSRTLRVVLDLITVKYLLRYSHRPMQMFGKIALLLGVPGLLLFAGMVAAHLSYRLFGTTFGAELIKRPFWLFTAGGLVLTGVEFIAIGLLAEVLNRTYHESQDRPIYTIRETIESPP
ncbi:MAG: glycosyltransferase family 2 protein [Kiritimatiellae bacterium]|nr:glycosyltransferase family 2 protein [Kiritimatiellia bacterium]